MATQILSSLLGTWLTSMVGDDASNDKLLVRLFLLKRARIDAYCHTLQAAAVLGLIMVWIAGRSLNIVV